MKAIKYNSREEAIAAVKLAIAKKREWVARVEREWAEEEVAKLSARWTRCLFYTWKRIHHTISNPDIDTIISQFDEFINFMSDKPE